jgi:hypothetical protein
MYKFIIFFTFIILSTDLYAQTEPVIRVKKPVSDIDSLRYSGNDYDFDAINWIQVGNDMVSVSSFGRYLPPVFKAEDYNGYYYIKQNLRIPSAVPDSVKGEVHVNFNITPAGYISDFKLFRKLHPLCDQAALDVVSKMPKWERGRIENGKGCKTNYTVRMVFS